MHETGHILFIVSPVNFTLSEKITLCEKTNFSYMFGVVFFFFFFTFFQEPQSFDEFRCKFCEFSGEWKSNSLLFWFVAKLLEDFCKCCFGSFWFLCEAYGSSLVFPLSPFKPAVMFCEEISKLCLISIFPPPALNFASFCCHDWMASYTCWVSSGRDVTKYKYLISVLLLYCFTACI